MSVDVRKTRKAVDFGEVVKYLADELYSDANKIMLVMDNRKHSSVFLVVQTVPAREARRLMAGRKFTTRLSVTAG